MGVFFSFITPVSCGPVLVFGWEWKDVLVPKCIDLQPGIFIMCLFVQSCWLKRLWWLVLALSTFWDLKDMRKLKRLTLYIHFRIKHSCWRQKVFIKEYFWFRPRGVFPPWAILPARGRLTVSGDMFGCDNCWWGGECGVPPAFSR